MARYQQFVLYALLANIVINIASFASRGQGALLALVILGLALVIIGCGMVAVFLLANELMGTGMGILCAVLLVIPCVSLITLLVVNQKATTYLQQNGIKVGLMGANPETI